MKRNGRLFAPLAVVAGLLACATAAAADDLDLAQEAVELGVLDQMRGGDVNVTVDDPIDGIAVNAADQDAFGVIFGSVGDTGSIWMAPNTFDDQRFNINAINSGNNVAMQNLMAVHVNFNNPAP